MTTHNRPWTRGAWALIDGRSIFQRQDNAPERPMIEVRRGGYKSFIAESWGEPAPEHGGSRAGNMALVVAAPELAEALIALLAMSDAISEHVPGAGWRMAQYDARAILARIGIT